MGDKVRAIYGEASMQIKIRLIPAVLTLVVCLILACSSAPLTPEEREYAQVERTEQWRICKSIYRAAGMPTYSTHMHSKNRKHKDWEVRDDLLDNQCRMILKRAGLWD